MRASRSVSEKTASPNRDVTERNKKKRREERDLPAFHTYPILSKHETLSIRDHQTPRMHFSL